MKLHPNNLRTPAELNIYKGATKVIKSFDALDKATAQKDQSSDDYNTTQDSVLLDSIRLNPDASVLRDYDFYHSVTRTASATQSRLSFINGDAKGSRTESSENVTYEIKQDRLGEPDTTRVVLDKATGEMDINSYWLGRIPAKPTFESY